MKKYSSPSTKILDLFDSRQYSHKRQNKTSHHSKQRTVQSITSKQNHYLQYEGYDTDRSKHPQQFTSNFTTTLHPINPNNSKPANSFNIKTFIRFRPFTTNQLLNSSTPIHNLSFIAHQSLKIYEKTYAFDRVFQPQSNQYDIYHQCARSLVDKFINGYNATIIAYGQTGSGKTYTMFGQTTQGIIPMAIEDIFQQLHNNQQTATNLQFSMLEIYRQNLIDLLQPNEDIELKIKQNTNQEISVSNLTMHPIQTPAQLLELIHRGNENKKIRETSLNQNSSRSHLILTLYLSTQHHSQIKKSKLNFIDLAGSQKVSKSKVQGQGLQQAKKINLSLSCLGNTINALIKAQQHIPYRQSKLTRLLQQSLGGNSLTSLVVTCSMNELCAEQTYTSIKFAHRASKVKTKPILNLIQKQQEEVNRFLYHSLKLELVEMESKLQAIQSYIDQLSFHPNTQDIVTKIQSILKHPNTTSINTPKASHHHAFSSTSNQKESSIPRSTKRPSTNHPNIQIIIKQEQQIIAKDKKILQLTKTIQQLQSNKKQHNVKLKISKNKPHPKDKIQKQLQPLHHNINLLIHCLEKDKNQYYKFQRQVLLFQIDELMTKIAIKNHINPIESERYKIQHEFVDKYIALLENNILEIYKFVKNIIERQQNKNQTNNSTIMEYSTEYYQKGIIQNSQLIEEEIIRKNQTIQCLKVNFNKLYSKNQQIMEYVEILERELTYSKQKVSFYEGFRRRGEELQKLRSS